MDEQLHQPQHEESLFVENENVGYAMDEQLDQPQHENETGDDAVDEQLRKYCQELVMTLELEQDQKERDKIQKEKYEVERKFQQQKADLERKIREDKGHGNFPTQVQSKDKWVECEEAHFEQTADIGIYSKKSCICCSA
ncbi:hypothetical protein ABBQ32_002927 [Trebouxia sp. C0010 RCD-2024]